MPIIFANNAPSNRSAGLTVVASAQRGCTLPWQASVRAVSPMLLVAVALICAALLCMPRAWADDAQPNIGQGADTQLVAGDAQGQADSAPAAQPEPVVAPSVSYRVRLADANWQAKKRNNQVAGRAGKGKRIQDVRISMNPGTFTGDILYRVRLANGKWQPWKKNGTPVGLAKNIEAIQVKITGSAASSYDVVYRTYAASVGWQARVRNGATAGTPKGKRIEALRVQIVSKKKRSGWASNSAGWSYYRKGKVLKSQWIATTESPINVMTAKSKRYWLDANGKLAVKRIVDPALKRDAGAGKAYYVSKWGYAKAFAKLKTSKGIAFSNSKGVLVTKAGWFDTARYDEEEVRYRLKAAGSYAVARSGFFKVKGKRYYGFPDRGFIVRDLNFKIGKKWYSADDKGVVGKATSAQIHIDRYVQWAINIANDNSHGYSQDLSLRWGPDYDCSSLVISSLKNTGLSVGNAVYTGNMKSELIPRGFRWHTDFSKLKRGDILLVHNANRQHTEIYLGNGLTVGAHIAETGGIYGVSGDQTGQEICIGPYYKIWEGYLRFGS